MRCSHKTAGGLIEYSSIRRTRWLRVIRRSVASQTRDLFVHGGGPSQLELFEDKPKLGQLSGQPPPPSLLAGRRFAFLKGTEKLLGNQRKFAQYGECGMSLSELLPHHRQIVDEVCWLRH